MQDNPKKLLSDQEIFEIFKNAKEQYEKYLEVNSFNKFSIIVVQEKFPEHIYDSWEKPLDLCLFKERKDALME